MKNNSTLTGLIFALLFLFALNVKAQDSLNLRVMTFNSVFGNIFETDKLNNTANIIRTLEPDVIAIQEDFLFSSFSTGLQLRLPQYNRHIVKSWWPLWETNVILTKYPIVERNDSGAKIKIGDNEYVWIYAIHLTPWFTTDPDLYEFNNPIEEFFIGLLTDFLPFAWTSFVNCGIETDIAVVEQESRDPHDREINWILNRVDNHEEDLSPVILLGDFNEPSHLDWTQDAVDAGIFGAPVNWHVSNRLADMGFTDAFREARPDETVDVGISFSATEEEYLCPEDNSVRIDYIYYNGNISFDNIFMVGDKPEFVDSVFTNYDSDHFVLIGDFKLFNTEGGRLAIEEGIEISTYPNPFNELTNITLELRQASKVRLEVYNTLGSKVQSIVDQTLDEGNYNFDWQPEVNLPSGIYLAVAIIDDQKPYVMKLFKQ